MSEYSSFLDDYGFAIFLFHGVIRRQRHSIRNYTRKHIELERFESILRDLVAHGAPVSMAEIVAAHAGAASLPPRAFAVTFDDGFENNYSVAAPVLRELGIPVTFYITTGFIESNALSWIDMIEYAVENKDEFRIDLKSQGPEGKCATREQKIELLDRIRRTVKADTSIDPYEFAHEFCRHLCVGEIIPDPDLDQKMTWEQIYSLSQDRLFDIGGHSHTHRILSFLGEQELDDEIETSLEKLHACLGVPIRHYSYPEGLAHCYSDNVISAMLMRGIVCCPTAEHGINCVGDDLFRLKRILVS